MSRSKATHRRSLLANVLLSAAVSATLAGALEGLARWREPSLPQSEEGALPVWREGWGRDFYTLETDPVGWPPWRRFNRDGLRDRSRPRQKPEGTVRVVVLGDSVTFGHGIEPAQAYPQVLESKLRSDGHATEVFNVALPAWSTRQQAIAFERVARGYAPDQVVLGVCLNDVPELQRNLGPPQPLLGWLHGHSALVRRVVDAPGLESQGVEELFRRPDAFGVRSALQLFFSEVRSLRDAVRRDGAEFLLVVFPFRFQLEPGAPAPVVQQRILEFCKSEGIACLDLLAALRAVGPQAFIDHDHLSPLGSERAADAILGSGLLQAGLSSAEVLARWAPYPSPGRGEGTADARLPPYPSGWALRSGDPAVRAAAAWTLGRAATNGEALALLQEALRDPSERVRLAATRALGALGVRARPALPRLFAALQDTSEPVRWAAAEESVAIGGGASETLAGLMTTLEAGDPHLRAFAAWSLGRLGAGAIPAVALLTRTLQGDEASLRWRAADALAEIGAGAAAAVPALIEALGHPHPGVRGSAARALGAIGPAAREAGGALERAKADADRSVRKEATRALERIR